MRRSKRLAAADTALRAPKARPIPAWGEAPGTPNRDPAGEGCKPDPSNLREHGTGLQPLWMVGRNREPGALPQAGLGWAFGPQRLNLPAALGRLRPSDRSQQLTLRSNERVQGGASFLGNGGDGAAPKEADSLEPSRLLHPGVVS